MNEAELVARRRVRVTCNNCNVPFSPYDSLATAPIIDEVKCPICGTKRILYFGEDTSVVKMILSTYGVNKELNERLDKIDSQIGSLKDMVKTSLDDARSVMTKSIIGALKEQINQHEDAYHNFGVKDGKPQN